ncbi:MAG: porin family protein [Alphaproteobacteria bacterium]
MKRLTTSLSILAGFVLSSTAVAQSSPFYLQVDGGASFPTENELVGLDLEYDTGVVFGGRLGFRPADAVRLEFSAAYTENDIDELGGIVITQSSVWIADFSVGAYGDLAIAPSLAAYLGGGAGIHYKELDDPGIEDDDTDISAHGEVGLSFDVTPNFSIVPHYRLTWFNDFFDDEQFHHWLRLGLRFNP